MGRFSVGDIERLLFAAYPATDALDGDRIGLFVGDRQALVTRVAVALDQSVPMVDAAAAAGCNLLVSHHPPFMSAPDSFLEAPSPAIANGATIYKAAQKGVALLAMHTNLDCAPSAARMLLEPVGLEYVGPLRAHASGGNSGSAAVPIPATPIPSATIPSTASTPSTPTQLAGLGQLARPADGREYILLGELAAAYQRSFGAVAKVWGDRHKPVFKAAACSGGASEVVSEVVAAGVDCFITGEVRHHEALYLMDAGIALIELGHDISELPYREHLRAALLAGGVDADTIVTLEPSASWWQPMPDNWRDIGQQHSQSQQQRPGQDIVEGQTTKGDSR
jgi:dinuclear metal center YbgI/SA1388 family protein